jgi:hypothetical protein
MGLLRVDRLPTIRQQTELPAVVFLRHPSQQESSHPAGVLRVS